MEHRRRLMQHKVNRSTLLKIVLADKRIPALPKGKMTGQSLVQALAIEAIEALQKNDNAYRTGAASEKPASRKEMPITSLSYQFE